MRHLSFYISFLLALLVLSACNPTKRMAADETFLRKHKGFDKGVKESKKEQRALGNDKAVGEINTIDTDDLDEILRTEPNKRLLGMRVKLWFYNRIDSAKQARHHERKRLRLEKRYAKRIAKGKDPKYKEVITWRDYFANVIGEPPATIDPSDVQASKDQLMLYLQKEGFFDAELVDTLEVKKFLSKKTKKIVSVKKHRIFDDRASLRYFIKTGAPYFIKQINYELEDDALQAELDNFLKGIKLKEGQRFSVEKMEDARNRFTEQLNNKGYYDFTREFIVFEADSTVGDYGVNLTMRVRSPRIAISGGDDVLTLDHKVYRIGKIVYETDFDPLVVNKTYSDRVVFEQATILQDSISYIDPELLLRNQFFRTGDLYQKRNVSLTYKRLSELEIFRSITIRFEEDVSADVPTIDCRILLNPLYRQSFSFETGLTNRQSVLGVPLEFSYGHRNLFKRGEELTVTFNTSVEAQPLTTENEDDNDANIGEGISRWFGLNTIEIGPEVNLRLNYWLLPGGRKAAKAFNPRTNISAVYNYQFRPDYERALLRAKLQYGGTFRRVNTFLNLDVSGIQIDKSQAFQERLDELNDPYLSNSYSNHFIPAIGVSGEWSSQQSLLQKSFITISGGVEEAGFASRALMAAFQRPVNNEGGYELFGVQFANYLRFTGDVRLFTSITNTSKLGLRLAAGAAKPQRNLDVVPFEKSFFAGGSNDIRAWRPRALGPGSSRDPDNIVGFNSIGDIKLLANLEYRFGLTGFIEGAFFMDAANIWLYPGIGLDEKSTFRNDQFLSELAIGTGVGLRLDFDFFLIRLDLGAQLKDPAKVRGERWGWEPKTEWNQFLIDSGQATFNQLARYPVSLNFGIGYPF